MESIELFLQEALGRGVSEATSGEPLVTEPKSHSSGVRHLWAGILGAARSLDSNPLGLGPAFDQRPDSSAGKSLSLSISFAVFLFSLSYSQSVTGSGSQHLPLFPGLLFLLCIQGLFIIVLVIIKTALVPSIDGAVMLLGCCQCFIVLSCLPLALAFS